MADNFDQTVEQRLLDVEEHSERCMTIDQLAFLNQLDFNGIVSIMEELELKED